MHKKHYGFTAALLLALLTLSCSQQPIFKAIAEEIKLLDPSVQGIVHSVVRCGNFLYTANGLIYRKSLKNERGWQKIPAPGGTAAYLASSDSHLYVLSANAKNCQVHALPAAGGEWTAVSGAAGTADTVALFDNGVSGSGRKAYVRVAGSVYELNNTAKGNPKTNNGAGSKTVAAARVNSTDYFSDTRAFCSDGTNLYSASGTTIKKGTTNTDLTDTSVSASEIITCLVYDAAENRLIVGTKKGLEQIDLSGGNPHSANLLGANAEAAVGESEIFSVACFSTDDDNALYAGAGKAASSKTNALWGYYPARGNWNYE